MKLLKGTCYITPADGQARSLEEEKGRGSWGEAAFMLIFRKHIPFSYMVKRVFCMSVSHSQIILVTNSQFSILWFIYSEINEPFAQHFPASISLYSTLSLVNCLLSFSKALSEHPSKQKCAAGHPLASSCILISNILSGFTGSVYMSSETAPRTIWKFTLWLKHGQCVWFG